MNNLLKSLRRRVRSWGRHHAGNDTRTFRPNFEPLESRLVPSIVPLSSPINVTTGTGGQSLTTHRTASEGANGDYGVVWENHAPGSVGGIYTRLFSSSGAPLDNPVQVANTSAADSEATIAMDLSGASVIAWTHTTGTTASVMFERFDMVGAPLGTPITISSAFKGGSTRQPSVAMDTACDIALAYTDSAPGGRNNVPTSNQVKGILYVSGGTSTPLTVTKSTATSQPSVAMNASGSFVIAFTQDASAANEDVYVQRFKAGGAPLGAGIAVAASSQTENEPSAAIDSQGDFVVAYTHISSSQWIHNNSQFVPDCWNNQADVHAVLYSAQGIVQQTQTVSASQKVTEYAYDPSAAMDAAGNFVVGYTRGGNYGKFVPSDGAASIWASAYSKAGALVQANIDLSANSLKPPPNPNGGNGGPVFYCDSTPTVALSKSGQLVADWRNFGLTINGEVNGSGVFTQAFVNAPFQYQLIDGLGLSIWGGMPANYQIAIARDPGFTGPITINFPQLPQGVHYTVSPDSPAPFEVLTVTFTSDDSSSGPISLLKISGGNVVLTPTVYIGVTPSVITSWQSADGSTLVLGFQATINGTGFVPGSTVQFGLPNSTATPTYIDKSQTWLNVNVPMSLFGGQITILRPGGQSIVSATIPQYTEGGINSLSTDLGFAPGHSAAFLNTGSEVDIFGFGFQQGAQVIFGDPALTPLTPLQLAGQLGATPFFIDPSGNSLKVTVPRYAVNGPVFIVEPDGTAFKSIDPADNKFRVSNYRDTFGFSFQNFPFNISWDMLNNEFGGNLFPDPFAVAVLGLAKLKLDGHGACFGMALTSVLLSEVHPDWINADYGLPYTSLPTVFNLQLINKLPALIEQNHLAQISAEMISYYLGWQVGSHSASDIKTQISNALNANDHPIISLQAGANHSVVAYALEPGPKANGDFYIDVYDPNRPFNGDGLEVTTATDHASVEQVSRIYIDPDSGWSFTMADNSAHSGGYDSLEVIPAGKLAGNLTFPAGFNGLLSAIFGSNQSSAPASGAAAMSFAPPAILGFGQVEAPRTVVSPASPRSTRAVLLDSFHDDVALAVAHARVGLGKHAGPTVLEKSDRLGRDSAWLSDPPANERLFAV